MSTLVLPAETKKMQPRWLYIILCVAFCALYFVRDVFDVNISYYVIYALATVIMLLVSREEAIAFFLSIASFTSAGFDGMFCLLMFGCFVLKFSYYMRTAKAYSCLLLLMCTYEVLHYMNNGSTAFGTVFTYVLVLLSLFIIHQYPACEIDKRFVINSFILFSLFFVLMTMVQMISAFGSLEALLEGGYRTELYSDFREQNSMTANQNYITQLCSVNLALCTLMLSKKEGKLPYIAAIAVFTISGLLTVSKMFIVVIVAYVVYIVFVTMKRSLKKGLCVLLLIVLAGGLLLLVGDSLFSIIEERFKNEELTSGRVEIIRTLLEKMKERPMRFLIGYGILQVHYVGEMSVHSSVFEILGGWGVPGLLFTATYLIALVKEKRYEVLEEGGTITGYNYLPLLILLGYTLVGMLFSSAFSVVQIMVCIYAMYIKERK